MSDKDGPAILIGTTYPWWINTLILKPEESIKLFGQNIEGDRSHVIEHRNHSNTRYLGKLHCTDGPAYISPSCKAYLQNNKFHRLNGPAYTEGGVERYFIEDIEYTKEDFLCKFNIYLNIKLIFK
jgi:hypothetical protein